MLDIIGKFMTNWKTYTLKDLSKGKGEYGIGAPAVPFDDEKYTYLRITDINDDGTLNKSGLMSVDDENAERYLLAKNDIVFARTGNSTGRSYFYDGRDGELVYAGFLIRFHLDEAKVNPKILKYYTHSKPYYDWVKSFDTGGTRGNINAKTYGDMPICLPPRHIQNRIAGILGAIDDKIENNRRINTNLELQAQALYKQWFVDNRSDDWTERALEEITLHITDGVHNTVIDTPNGDGYLLSCKNIKNGLLTIGNDERRISNETLTQLRKRTRLDKGDILLTSVGTIGEMLLVNEYPTNYEFQRSVAMIKPNPQLVSSYFLYLALLNNKIEIKHLAHGAVQQCIFISDLKEYSVVVPNVEFIASFDKIVAPIFETITRIQKENKVLATLRDTLLPKLMNDEIKVNE